MSTLSLKDGFRPIYLIENKQYEVKVSNVDAGSIDSIITNPLYSTGDKQIDIVIHTTPSPRYLTLSQMIDLYYYGCKVYFSKDKRDELIEMYEILLEYMKDCSEELKRNSLKQKDIPLTDLQALSEFATVIYKTIGNPDLFKEEPKPNIGTMGSRWVDTDNIFKPKPKIDTEKLNTPPIYKPPHEAHLIEITDQAYYRRQIWEPR